MTGPTGMTNPLKGQALRRLAFGLATLHGRALGFFIPYRYAAGVIPPAPGGYGRAAALMDEAAPAMTAILAALPSYRDEWDGFGGPPPAPRWDQDWFPPLDAAVAWHMVRSYRPARIVEVGSGHSTRFLAAALARSGAGTITAIDPAPRADIAGLPGMTIHRATLQDAGLEPFAAIRSGDIVSVDSSHILMPGTDVDVLFAQVIPALPSGTILHVHDIFLPDGYPPDWEWRGYNEQSAVAILLGTGRAEVLFASHYAATRLADAVAASPVASLPAPPDPRPASLWLRLR